MTVGKPNPGWLTISLLLATAMSLNGCMAIGTLLHVTVGDPPTPALYVPAVEPTLVLVENYRSPGEMQLDGDQVAHDIGEELKKETKLQIVDPDKLVPMREDDPVAFRKMSSQAIGKALNAKQVIYVDLLESEVAQDASGGSTHATATARVKVIDTTTGNTLWPMDAVAGKEITASMPYDQSDSSRVAGMHTELLSKLSSTVAKLFYNSKSDSQSDDNAS